MKNKKENFVLAIIFILTGILLRLVPHAPNFSPISAIALFSGAYLSKKWGIFIAVFAMAVSDLYNFCALGVFGKKKPELEKRRFCFFGVVNKFFYNHKPCRICF